MCWLSPAPGWSSGCTAPSEYPVHGIDVSLRRELSRSLEHLERAWGIQAVVYATSEGHEKIVRHVRDDRPLWIRSIFREPGPGAYGGWEIWQYSGNSRLPGITGLVDRNVLDPSETLEGLRRNVRHPVSPPSSSP